MGTINPRGLHRGAWADLETALINNQPCSTAGPFPNNVLGLPTTTGSLIAVYARALMDFQAAEFLDRLYTECLLESLEDGEDDYGFVDEDEDDEDGPGDTR